VTHIYTHIHTHTHTHTYIHTHIHTHTHTESKHTHTHTHTHIQTQSKIYPQKREGCIITPIWHTPEKYSFPFCVSQCVFSQTHTHNTLQRKDTLLYSKITPLLMAQRGCCCAPIHFFGGIFCFVAWVLFVVIVIINYILSKVYWLLRLILYEFPYGLVRKCCPGSITLKRKKSVAIIGAGPSGIRYARHITS